MKPLLLTLCLMLLSGCRPEATKPPSPWDVSRLQPPMTEAELTEAKRLLAAALDEHEPTLPADPYLPTFEARIREVNRLVARSETLLASLKLIVTNTPNRGHIIVAAATEELLRENNQQAKAICDADLASLERISKFINRQQ